MKKTIERPGFTFPGIEEITRRDFLVGGAAAILLGGCGGGGSEESASGETRTVEHALGTTEVPVRPQRIVAVTGQMDLDALLALGLQPVAAGANFEDDTEVNPWSVDRLDDAEVFTFRPEINVEQVATFEPDLIVGHIGWMEPVYDQLSQVAPTVVVEYDGGAEGEDAMWRGSMRTGARAVGREERGEEVLSKIDDEIERVGERLSGLGDLTVSVFTALGEGFQAYYTPRSYPGYVLEQLGLSRSKSQTEIPAGVDDPSEIEFSNERLDILDGDVAFCLGFGEGEYLDEFESRPLFRSLGVVERGGYVRLTEAESGYWYYPTVFTPPLMIESLIGHLERLDILKG